LGHTMREDIHYHSVGDTDSEAVFCAILNALSVEFPDGLPTLPVLHEFLAILCHEITEQDPSTIFNFLLGCGQYTLFAYSWPGQRAGSKVWNGLYYLVRQPPFRSAKLLDVDLEIDFARVTTPGDRVAVIATKPLTEEPGWVEFKRGELLMFDKGLPYRTPKCCEIVEKEGRGLFSKAVTAKCNRSPRPRYSSCPRLQQQQSPPTLSLAPSPLTSAAEHSLGPSAAPQHGLPPSADPEMVRCMSDTKIYESFSSESEKMATSAGVFSSASATAPTAVGDLADKDTSLALTNSLARVAIQ